MEIQITPIQSLHDVVDQPGTNVKTHIQAEKDFLYDFVAQKDIDEGNINLKNSQNGYASVVTNSAQQNAFLVIKSIDNSSYKGKLWKDIIPANGKEGDKKRGSEKRKSMSTFIWIAVIVIIILLLQKKQE